MRKNNCAAETHCAFCHCLSLVLLSIFFHSCTISKPATYFTALAKDTTISYYKPDENTDKITLTDRLSITVSSMNSEMDLKFNELSKYALVENEALQPTRGIGLNKNGQLYLHNIGWVRAEGLTRAELKAKLESKLQDYMKDPIIDISYTNRKVTIIGDVQSPKILNLADNNLNLIDALVASGDIQEDAQIDDIMIIRDSATQKLVKHINLEDHQFFNTPWYYLQPNDMVYVKKNIKIDKREESRRAWQTTISLVVSIMSLAIIIFNNFIK